MKAFIIGKSKKNNKNNEKKGLKNGESTESKLIATKNSLKLQHYNSAIFNSQKSKNNVPLSPNSPNTTSVNNNNQVSSIPSLRRNLMDSSTTQNRIQNRVTLHHSNSCGSNSNMRNLPLPTFKVGIRLRPLLKEEQEDPEVYEELVHYFPQNNILCIKEPGMYNEFPEIDDGPPPPPGTIAPSMGPYINTNPFHYVFGGNNNNNSQDYIYYESIKPLVSHFLNGNNSLVLAYGQLGSGKTYSIGLNADDYSEDQFRSNVISSQMGFIPRAVNDTLNCINNKINENKKMSLYITFVAISCEDVADLLGESISRYKRPPSPGPRMSSPNDQRNTSQQPKSILVHDSGKKGIMLKGARYENIEDLKMLAKLIYRGTTFRKTVFGPESENLSHAILTLHMEQTGEKEEKIYSKMHFVDLSCTEKTPPGEARKNRMECGVNDKSWLALSKVINLLTGNRPKGYIPYRDSKLTQIIQDSLCGDSLVLFLSCVSPTACEETKSTLKYMIRTTNIDIRNTIVTPKMLKTEPLRIQSMGKSIEEIEEMENNNNERESERERDERNKDNNINRNSYANNYNNINNNNININNNYNNNINNNIHDTLSNNNNEMNFNNNVKINNNNNINSNNDNINISSNRNNELYENINSKNMTQSANKLQIPLKSSLRKNSNNNNNNNEDGNSNEVNKLKTFTNNISNNNKNADYNQYMYNDNNNRSNFTMSTPMIQKQNNVIQTSLNRNYMNQNKRRSNIVGDNNNIKNSTNGNDLNKQIYYKSPQISNNNNNNNNNTIMNNNSLNRKNVNNNINSNKGNNNMQIINERNLNEKNEMNCNNESYIQNNNCNYNNVIRKDNNNTIDRNNIYNQRTSVINNSNLMNNENYENNNNRQISINIENSSPLNNGMKGKDEKNKKNQKYFDNIDNINSYIGFMLNEINSTLGDKIYKSPLRNEITNDNTVNNLDKLMNNLKILLQNYSKSQIQVEKLKEVIYNSSMGLSNEVDYSSPRTISKYNNDTVEDQNDLLNSYQMPPPPTHPPPSPPMTQKKTSKNSPWNQSNENMQKKNSAIYNDANISSFDFSPILPCHRNKIISPELISPEAIQSNKRYTNSSNEMSTINNISYSINQDKRDSNNGISIINNDKLNNSCNDSFSSTIIKDSIIDDMVLEDMDQNEINKYITLLSCNLKRTLGEVRNERGKCEVLKQREKNLERQLRIRNKELEALHEELDNKINSFNNAVKVLVKQLGIAQQSKTKTQEELSTVEYRTMELAKSLESISDLMSGDRNSSVNAETKYQNIVKEYEEELNDLQKEKSDIIYEKENLQHQNEGLQMKIKTLLKTMKILQNNLKESEKMNLYEVNKDINKLTKANEELRRKLENTLQDKKIVEKKLMEMELNNNNNSNIYGNNDYGKSSTEGLTINNPEVREKLMEYEKKIENLESQLCKTEESHQVEVYKLLDKLSLAEEKSNAIANNNIKSYIMKIEKELNQAKQIQNEYKRNLEMAESTINKKINEYKELENKCTNQQKSIQKLQDTVNTYENSQTKLLNSNYNLSSQIKNVNSNQSSHSYAGRRSMLNDTKKMTITELQDELLESRQEIELLNKKNWDLKLEVDRYQSANESNRRTIMLLMKRMSVDNIKDRINKTNNSNKDSPKSIHSNLSKNFNINNDNSSCRSSSCSCQEEEEVVVNNCNNNIKNNNKVNNMNLYYVDGKKNYLNDSKHNSGSSTLLNENPDSSDEKTDTSNTNYYSKMAYRPILEDSEHDKSISKDNFNCDSVDMNDNDSRPNKSTSTSTVSTIINTNMSDLNINRSNNNIKCDKTMSISSSNSSYSMIKINSEVEIHDSLSETSEESLKYL